MLIDVLPFSDHAYCDGKTGGFTGFVAQFTSIKSVFMAFYVTHLDEGENSMQALRRIQIVDSYHIFLKIPKAFMQRSIEIIIMPFDNSRTASETSVAWPKDFFAKTAGCLADSPLTR